MAEERPRDFRSHRRRLPTEAFAVGPPGDWPPPSDLVSEEVWSHVTGLTDHVSFMTSDHHGRMLAAWYALNYEWIEQCGDGRNPDLLFDPMLDAHDEYDAAGFLALNGFYRQAIGCLRNALELVAIGAGCEARHETQRNMRWRTGTEELGLGVGCDLLRTKPIELHLQSAVGDTLFEQRPNAGYIRRFFSTLSDYSHSRPGKTNADMWASNGPIYEPKILHLFDSLLRRTYGSSYILVKLARPQFALSSVSSSLLHAVIAQDAVLVEAWRYLDLQPSA